MASLSENTLITLVLYKCNLEDSDAYKSLLLANQTNKLHVLIYNNSPEYSCQPISSNYHSIELIQDSSNSGVSKAYNYGAKKAKELQLNWLLLLDQDTIFPSNFFEITNQSINDNPNEKLFAPILVSNNQFLSPCYFKFNRGKIAQSVQTGRNNFKDKSLLNSGLLIDVVTFEKIGGYNENIKLDFSDFYFIEKFKKIHSSFVLTTNRCEHSLSSSESDVKKLLDRFNFYCTGAVEYGKSTNKLFQISILLIVRSILLTFRHKTTNFLKLVTVNLLTKN